MYDKSIKEELPLITIISVVYNGEKSLEDTILSIITQSYSKTEFIIIDGGSKDATLDIVRKYSEKIDRILSEPDNGIYDAMNKGIELSTGDYIIFMNSGDKFFNDFTISSVFSQNENREEIIYGDTILLDEGSSRLIRSRNISDIKKRLPFCHQSVFVSSSILKEHRFDLTYSFASDYDLFLSLYLKNKYSFKKLNIPVSVFDNNGVSSSLVTVREYSSISSKHFPYSVYSLYHKLRLVYFSFTDCIKKKLPAKLVQKILEYKRKI